MHRTWSASVDPKVHRFSRTRSTGDQLQLGLCDHRARHPKRSIPGGTPLDTPLDKGTLLQLPQREHRTLCSPAKVSPSPRGERR